MKPAVSLSASASRPAAAAVALLVLTACAGHLSAPVRPTVPVTDPAPARATALSEADLAYLRGRQLLVPVANVRARSLSSSFDAPRDGGARAHLAIDILAPRGTPVLAADDGHIWTVRSNALGGLTVYTVDPEERFVFYYAHLDHYRQGIADGMPVLKGDTLGFVGTTGNAPPDVPHLHFQVSRIGSDHHWWTGTPIDPLPFLYDVDVAMAGRRGATQATAVARERSDRLEPISVPTVRTRRVAPTVPVDTAAAPADTSARVPGPHGAH